MSMYSNNATHIDRKPPSPGKVLGKHKWFMRFMQPSKIPMSAISLRFFNLFLSN